MTNPTTERFVSEYSRRFGSRGDGVTGRIPVTVVAIIRTLARGALVVDEHVGEVDYVQPGRDERTRKVPVCAEPVRLQTLESFSEFFAPCGFRPETFSKI